MECRPQFGSFALAGTLYAATACFAEAPTVASGDGSTDSSSTSAETDPTTIGSEASADTGSTTDDVDSSGEDDASGDATASGESESSGADDSSGTEGAQGCEAGPCLDRAVLCEDFESWSQTEPPWMDLGGNADPELTTDVVACGQGSLACAVSAGRQFCATEARLATSEFMGTAESKTQSLRFFVQLDSGCFEAEQGLTRVVQIRFDSNVGGGGGYLYAFNVWLGDGLVDVCTQGLGAGECAGTEPAPIAADTWHALRLDFLASEPHAELLVDGVIVLSVDGEIAPDFTDLTTLSVIPGPYRDVTFTEACTVHIDDLSLAPTPS